MQVKKTLVKSGGMMCKARVSLICSVYRRLLKTPTIASLPNE